MSRRLTGFSYFSFQFFGQRSCFLFAAKLKLSLKFISSSEVIFVVNLNKVSFFSFTCFLIMKKIYKKFNFFFYISRIQFTTHSQRIRRANTAKHAEQTNHTNIHTNLTNNDIFRTINLSSGNM